MNKKRKSDVFVISVLVIVITLVVVAFASNEDSSNSNENGLNAGEKSLNKIEKKEIRIEDFGESYKVYTDAEDVSAVLDELEVKLGKNDYTLPAGKTKLEDIKSICIYRVTEEEHIDNVSIPFKEVIEYDDEIADGEEVIVSEGKFGLSKTKYLCTYSNGKLRSKKIIEKLPSIKPVDKKTKIGTYVEPEPEPEPEPEIEVEEPEQETEIAVEPKPELEPEPEQEPEQETEEVYEEENEESGSGNLSGGMVFEATAYTGGGITASGIPAGVGYVAVDPSVIPLGTNLYIESMSSWPDYGYAVAADTGGAINGRIVDLYFDDYDTCIQFGRRDVMVYIVD